MKILKKTILLTLLGPAVALLWAASAFAYTLPNPGTPADSFITYPDAPNDCQYAIFQPDGSFSGVNTTSIASPPCDGFSSENSPGEFYSTDGTYTTFEFNPNTALVGMDQCALDLQNGAQLSLSDLNADCVDYISAYEISLTTFTVFSSAPTTSPGVIAVPLGLAAGLTAVVGDQLGDSGTLTLLAYVFGIPLLFFIMKELIDLIPKKGQKRGP